MSELSMTYMAVADVVPTFAPPQQAHPGMVSVRCIKPAGEDFDQDFTPDALLKIKITENWKGDKLHELKGGDLCAKDYKFNV